MFDKLFGSKKPSGPKPPAAPKPRRVNIERRFTIIAETGQGSMSKVYKALDKEAGRTVCLKVQDLAKATDAAARAAKEGRLTEGEIGKRITHPHVVRTYEWGLTHKGAQFVVMEFVDGVSLQFIRQSRVLDLAAKLDLLIQTAEGMAAIHAAGFIHHDFGPKNALVDRNDQVKIIDFGLAVPNTPAFRKPGNRTGTMQYMAPELLRREPTDERIDIFSFGAAAFEFLTGKLPYDATDPMAMMRQRINSDPMDIAEVAPHLPEDLSAVIRKALTRRKEDRWPSMTKVVEELRALPIASH
jgi:eukaryotic-like serine/threonine-protein kinase